MVVAQVAPRVFDVGREQLEEFEVLVVFVQETWVAACWASPLVVVATAIEVVAAMPLPPVPPLGSWHPKQKLQEVAEKKSTQLDFLFAVWESREAVASKQTALLETESENSES